MKQTAVEWLQEQLSKILIDNQIQQTKHLFEQAEEMGKQHMDKVAGDWWNEGASYMHDGKRKYETFEQYYKETFNK